MAKIKIAVSATKEDHSPEHAEKTFGYVAGFAQDVRESQRKHSRLWGWCSVEVCVTYYGHSASAYLGGCCYESKTDFIHNSGYYASMVQDALEELLEVGKTDWTPEDVAYLRREIAECKATLQTEYDTQRAELAPAYPAL